jgi:hypothetical protein
VLERVEAGPEPERSAPGPARAERGSLTGSIIGLQRQIGNAAVTRLLEREVEELGPSPPTADRICGTVAPSTSTGPPTRLDPLDPVISTVAGPCLEDWAGGYFRYVTYMLPQPAPSGGFLIQELYHVGQARFYPGPLSPEFGPESPTVDSYLARSRPTGWTGAGARHDCYAEWGRRTGGARDRGLVAFAATTECRAGDTVSDARPRPSFTP